MSEFRVLPVARWTAMIEQCNTDGVLCHVSTDEQHYLEKVNRQISKVINFLCSVYLYSVSQYVRIMYLILCIHVIYTWNCFIIVSMGVSNKKVSLRGSDLFIPMNVQKQVVHDGTKNGCSAVFPVRCRIHTAVPPDRNQPSPCNTYVVVCLNYNQSIVNMLIIRQRNYVIKKCEKNTLWFMKISSTNEK